MKEFSTWKVRTLQLQTRSLPNRHCQGTVEDISRISTENSKLNNNYKTNNTKTQTFKI